MAKPSNKRKRARARGMRKQSRRELRKMKQSEHHFLACLLVHGEPPRINSADHWSTTGATHPYLQYCERVQKWWIDRVTSYPPPQERAGIRFFRRYMKWYNAQKREQDDGE